MEQTNDKPAVAVMLLVMAFTIYAVEDPMARLGLGIVPGLLLAQRALFRTGLGADLGGKRTEGSELDRVPGLREVAEELLKLLREFYITCHMVSVGELTHAKGEEKAQGVERQLNRLISQMLDKGLS